MFLDAQARGTCPVNHDAGAHARFGVSMPAAAFSPCSMPPSTGVVMRRRPHARQRTIGSWHLTHPGGKSQHEGQCASSGTDNPSSRYQPLQFCL